MPMILGSITWYSHLAFFISEKGVFGPNITLPPPTASTQSKLDHDRNHPPSNNFAYGSSHPWPLKQVHC